MFDRLHQSIRTFGTFTDDELELLSACLKPRALQKGDSVIREGQTCRSFWFINAGAFRQYQLPDDGIETTLQLFVESDWMTESQSLINQQPAETAIEATENSEVLELTLLDFHELVKASDAFFRVGKIFQTAVRNNDYQSNRLTPEAKYQSLLANRPEILQKFSLKIIASYLAMTPETLSRVRRKMLS